MPPANSSVSSNVTALEPLAGLAAGDADLAGPCPRPLQAGLPSSGP